MAIFLQRQGFSRNSEIRANSGAPLSRNTGPAEPISPWFLLCFFSCFFQMYLFCTKEQMRGCKCSLWGKTSKTPLLTSGEICPLSSRPLSLLSSHPSKASTFPSPSIYTTSTAVLPPPTPPRRKEGGTAPQAQQNHGGLSSPPPQPPATAPLALKVSPSYRQAFLSSSGVWESLQSHDTLQKKRNYD